MAITTLSLRMTPRPAALQQLGSVAEPMLRAGYADGHFVFAVLTAVHEIASNVIEHASPSSDIEVTFELSDSSISIAVFDDGVPFEGLLDLVDEAPSSFAAAKSRGRGLQLTKALVDELSYRRESNLNCWRLRKQIAA